MPKPGCFVEEAIFGSGAEGWVVLIGTSMQGIAGWFDPDEQDVPFDMFAGGCGAPTREGLIKQYKIGYLIDLRQKPVGKRATAATGNLPAQQLDGTVEDSVVVRFR